MQLCDCNQGFKNTGKPNCDQAFRVTRNFFAVQMVDDDGNDNSVLLADVIDSTFITAKVNDPDKSKRWFPINGFEAIESTRADQITQEFPSGKAVFIRDGIKPWIGQLPGDTPVYLEALESFACRNFGIFLVDIKSNLRGELNDAEDALNPIEVDNDTWYPSLIDATDSTTEGLQVAFQFSQNVQDSRLRMILASEMTVNLLKITGLQQVDGTSAGAPTATTVAVKLTTEVYGWRLPIDVKGWEDSDFLLTNLDTNLPVAISGSVEAPLGTYTLTFASAPAANMLLEDSVTKTGFDLEFTFLTP